MGWETYDGSKNTCPKPGWSVFCEYPGEHGAVRVIAPENESPPVGTRWMYCGFGEHSKDKAIPR